VIEEKPVLKGRAAAFITLGVLVALAGVVALSAGFYALLEPLVGAGAEVTAEWEERLAVDYPDWVVLELTTRSGWYEGRSYTYYTFTMMPPDRDFPVGLVYVANSGGTPQPKDKILRPAGEYASRAEALLDFLEAEYVADDKEVTSVSTLVDGSALVAWRPIGVGRRLQPSHVQLGWDDGTDTWYIRDEMKRRAVLHDPAAEGGV
jgi:hypothetical protein